jgi:lipoprotein-anchoring transpeptidase ErfK/SrfK
MVRASGLRAGRTAFLVSFWRIAVLTTAGAIASTSQAKAALHFWSDVDPAFSVPAPDSPPRQLRRRLHPRKKIAAPTKESVKPQGPLIVAISIEKQKLKIYDANGFFAETPISTGMRGHSTPMGLFSVIQKQRFHRSNIYSGAPMPYMQRITWSGVALHAGVLPGYPASHGCIRMPAAFAVKMWGWTRLGARVVITPGEMTPADFSHPLLAAKVVQPISSGTPQADALSAKANDKTADAVTALAISKTNVELKATLGHNEAEPAAGITIEKSIEAKPTALPEIKTPEVDASKSLKVTDASAGLPDANSRPTPATIPTPKRAGQLAVLISRKDSKIYVRQDFAPLFDAPISVAPDDRPLGTHVFTARVDKNDADAVQWSVVSLPARSAEHRDEVQPTSRSRKIAGALTTKASPIPDSPAEALSRLSIPADVMARINEALSTGSSIIVSDQGIAAGETGEGTDFIVSLR